MHSEWADSERKFPALAGIASKNIRINRTLPYLEISESSIRRISRERNKAPLPIIFLYQAFSETTLRTLKKIRFRKGTNLETCAAYRKMSPQDFEAINLRQAWSNWRTIPRNLNHHLPNRPLHIIDLCCGIGNSTEVLAYYAAPSSEILGLEFNPDFLAQARNREYRDENGRPCRTTFHSQSVLETFCNTHGRIVADESIDLVNSCGAIGCHFDPESTNIIAQEVARVVKPGGLATIDSGNSGTPRRELEYIFSTVGFTPVHAARSCAVDRYTQICFIKSQ